MNLLPCFVTAAVLCVVLLIQICNFLQNVLSCGYDSFVLLAINRWLTSLIKQLFDMCIYLDKIHAG